MSVIDFLLIGKSNYFYLKLRRKTNYIVDVGLHCNDDKKLSLTLQNEETAHVEYTKTTHERSIQTLSSAFAKATDVPPR